MSSFVINPRDRKKIERLLSMSEDQLYANLQQHNPEHRGKFFSSEKQIEVGKNDLQELKEDLHQSICENWKLCDKIDSPNWNDPVVLVASIADVITTQIGGWIPAFTISTILVKIGIRKFCECKN